MTEIAVQPARPSEAGQGQAAPPAQAQPPAYVSAEAFEQMLAQSDARLEWSQGRIIEMPPQSLEHNQYIAYFLDLFRAYFALKPVGLVVFEFGQKLEAVPSYRFPDLMIVLHENPAALKRGQSFMHGPADICIEIVSEGSIAEDYGHKFEEYQQGGVKEYWLFNPINQQHLIYRLDEAGIYRPQELNAARMYHTPLLPGFALHVPTLWAEALPGFFEIAEAARLMVQEGDQPNG